jgi:Cu(I)/Ag(I) efflux system membrane fusion protein
MKKWVLSACVLVLCLESGLMSTERSEAAPADIGSEIALTKAQQDSGWVTIMVVREKSMEAELRRTGSLNFDEEKVSVVAARVSGREVRVLAFEGQKVRKDDPLAYIYSPDYTTAEVELLNAFKVASALKDQAESLAYIRAAERKLKLLGASQDDVEDLSKRRTISKYLTLHAPRSGVILGSVLRAGLFMNPGDQLMTIANLSSLLVYMDIYEGDFPLVRIGQKVSLETVAYPGRVFSGKIVYLGGMVDPNTRTFHVRAEIPNPRNLLKPGMFANVRIRLSAPRPVVAVPEVSVLRDEHGYHVFVEKKPGLFDLRVVVPGREENGWIRIESGLHPGEKVAVKGALLLEGIREVNMSKSSGTTFPRGRIGGSHP